MGAKIENKDNNSRLENPLVNIKKGMWHDFEEDSKNADAQKEQDLLNELSNL